MDKLQVRLFGGFECAAACAPIALSARKARALLAYLALNPDQAHARDKLADLLWGEAGEASARVSLRQALAAIRRALPKPFQDVVEADTTSVTMLSRRIDLDVAAFRRTLADNSTASLEHAVALYRGDLFDGLHVGAAGFDHWLSAEREGLRERALQAMSDLLAHYQADGAAERGIRVATRLLAEDPFRESAHRALMRLYVQQDRRAEALKQYRRLRETLARELAVPPEQETHALFQEIQQDRRRPSQADPQPEIAEASSEIENDAAPAETTVRDREPELRQATILFADMTGFTELTTDLDPEDLQTLLAQYLATVDAIVERHGGTVDKHIGDSVMAVFGLPTARSNDPHRAAHAALEMHSALDAVDATPKHEIKAHIGIASGQVLRMQARGNTTVTGEAVNLAARLTETATSGQTLLSDSVHRSLAAAFEGEEVANIAVRGLPAPISAWSLTGLASAMSSRTTGRFVGRRSEQRQFERIIEDCLDDDAGTTVLVRGEAGIGKTRLVEEMAAAAERQGFVCHKGLILDFGTLGGQYAVRTVLCGMLSAAMPAVDDLSAAADAVLREGWIDEEARGFLFDLLGLTMPKAMADRYGAMEPAARRRGRQATAASLVLAAARSMKAMLIFEDVHWADQGTLGALAVIAGIVADCPVLLVLTSRTENDPLDRAWREAARRAPFMTMDLGPLRPKEAAQLAEAMATGADDYVQSCLDRAAGHPLFLEQLLLGAGEANTGDVPGSVHSIVLSRMDALGPDERRALQAASVLGQRFSGDALRFLLDAPAFDLSGLVKEVFLREEGGQYLFAHALVLDAVYASLIKSRRRALHRRAADWFSGQDPVFHAEHLERAEDENAAAAYLDAAMAMAEQYRNERGLELADRGLALAQDRSLRHTLFSVRGNMLRNLGRIEESIGSFTEATTQAKTTREISRAHVGVAKGYRILDRYPDALAALDEAEAVLPTGDHADRRAQINVLRGNIYFPLGRIGDCLQAHENALEHAKTAKSLVNEARAESGIGDAYYLMGDMRSAYDHFLRCVTLARDNGFARIEVSNLYMLAVVDGFLLRMRQAEEHWRAALEMAVQTANLRAEMLARNVAAMLELMTGNWLAVKDQATRSMDLARQIGSRRFEGDMIAFGAAADRWLGNPRLAEQDAQRSLAIAHEVGPEYAGGSSAGVLAFVARDRSVFDAAIADGEAILSRGCVSHNYLHFYFGAMEGAMQWRDWDLVERLAAAMEDCLGGVELPWKTYFAGRGRVVAALGRGDRSVECLAEAQRLNDWAAQIGLHETYRIELP